MAVLAEETGYPADMLDPDLDLEADLGIDTVKQAEVFATIREAWGIPFDDALKLRDYPTLADVAQFVRDHTASRAGGRAGGCAGGGCRGACCGAGCRGGGGWR